MSNDRTSNANQSGAMNQPAITHPLPVLVHVAIVAGTFIAMAAWTWFGWPDPIVDFGRELYVPWRITEGQVLYRDIAYFNGPLSPHLNALVFTVLGVSFRSIAIANLVLLALLTWLIWRLFSRIADRLTATACCVLLLTVFSFIQLLLIGNYNFIAPYSHEITHGVILSFVAMALLARDIRTMRSIWLVGAGLALGCVFLTKAEVFLAAAAAVSLGVVIASPGRVLRAMAVFVGAAVIPPLLAFAVLCVAMPAGEALRGTLGSWVYAFNPAISGLKFYRDMVGTSDLARSLLGILQTCMIFVGMLVPTLFAATHARGKVAVRTVFVVAVAASLIVYWVVKPNWWQDAFSGLTLIMAGNVVVLTARWWRRRRRADLAVIMQLVVSVFALVLLAKMALHVRIAHYGFALAMPAMLVLAAALLCWIPREIEHYRGDGNVVRAVALPMLALVIAVHLRPYANLFADKPMWVGGGADAFRCADVRGVAVNRMLEALATLPHGATVATIPEGIMINYLARRPNPTEYINLMPPEVIMFGQENVLADFQAHPPDYLVLVLNSDPASYGYRSFAADYGAEIYKWVRAHYEQVPTQPVKDFPLMLMRKR